jgi:hypothetical protein
LGASESLTLELTVEAPKSTVFDVMLERLPDIVTVVSMVDHRDRELRAKNDHEIMTVDRWRIAITSGLPGFLARFVSFEAITVESRIHWDLNAKETDWSLSLPDRQGLLENATGEVTFSSGEKGTRLLLNGEFNLDLSGVPGIPSFLAGTLQGHQGRIAERILNRYRSPVADQVEKFCNEAD